MKKLYIIVSLLCMCCFTACSNREIAGEELILNQRKKFSKLESATFVLADEESGEIEQSFSYKYNKDGSMTYLFFSKTDENNYIEYNNGKEMTLLKDGDITQTSKDDINFVSFSKDDPHPNSGEGLLIYDKSLVMKSSRLDAENQIIITHEYDVKKLKKVNKELGEVKKFMVMYYFTIEGELNFYTESTQIERDGALHENMYRVSVSEENMIKEIDKPNELIS